MADAWIDGRPVALDAAISEAARLLGASRALVVAGLGTDIAGARAAIALAQRLGAAVDHMHSEVLFRDLAVMRAGGTLVTTRNEARLQADVLLLVGGGLVEAWPELPQRLFAPLAGPAGEGAAERRRIIWLCPGDDPKGRAGTEPAQVIGRSAEDLPVLLAALRARVAGHPVGRTRVAAKVLDALAADLRRARFGVAVWSAADLDALAIEMLCGLVADLNGETRFSGLALAPPDNALGVLQACGWMTGFAMRTGFSRGYPEHDPWRFDATRLIDSGEADCALWISAYHALGPQWQRQVPTIALTAQGARFREAPRVHIDVGRPGTDHDAVEHCPTSGTLVSVAATKRSGTISVADVIAHLAAALPSAGAWPC
jgi:formylmethanofuran dehydrogenase subunit B